MNQSAKVEALDTSGKVLATQDIGVPAGSPVVSTTAP